jgi:streptomycin 6-kinase
MVGYVIDIPGELAASQQKYNGEAGQAFIAGLPPLAAGFLDRWELRLWRCGYARRDRSRAASVAR